MASVEPINVRGAAVTKIKDPDDHRVRRSYYDTPEALEVSDSQFRTVADVVSYLKSQADNNSLDEAVVKADDGRLFVVFADHLPRTYREGSRFNYGEMTGTIKHVQRELDLDKLALRITGYAVSVGVGLPVGVAIVSGINPTFGGALIVGGLILAPFTGGASVAPAVGMIALPLALPAAGIYGTEKLVSKLKCDPSSLLKMSKQVPAGPTDPKTALQPK